MSHGHLDAVVRHLRRLAGAGEGDSTDRELLERFVISRDEDAFAVLVRRHGGLIRAVCRHILHQEEDAEDALQATLVVFARKAASIRKGDSVASWLYGVAYRTARNAKKIAARRRQHEHRAASRSPERPVSEAALHELQALLDAEVQGLPPKYRAPFVLCCLEGKSKAEAARELGWKEGTVSGRLAEARKRLQNRLLRRGVTLSAALCAARVFQDTAKGAVPATVIRAVLSYTAGKTGAVSAPAIILAEGVRKAMIAAKLKLGVLLFSVLISMATGIGLVAQKGFADKPTQPNEPQRLQLAGGGAPPGPAKTNPVPTDRFGDPLPPRVLTRLGTVRMRHGGSPIELVAISPDGQTVISASQDGMVRLWEAATGKEIRHLQTREDQNSLGSCFAISRDRSFLASATQGHSAAEAKDLRIWDLATGNERLSLRNQGYFGHGRIAISPDGKLLAWAGQQDAVSLWDANTGQLLRRINDIIRGVHAFDPAALAFSPDSRTLAVGQQSDRTIRLLDTATGTEQRRFPLPASPGTEGKAAHTSDTTTDLAFSPDGKVLAALQRAGQIGVNVFLWDVTTGRELRHSTLLPWTFRAYRLAYSPDGKMLAFGCTPGPVRVCDSATLQLLREFPSGKELYASVAFSPDGRTLAVGVNSTIRLWDISTGKERFSDLGHAASLDSCTLSPDQRHLVTAAGDGTVRRWELATGKEVSRVKLPPDSYNVVLSPDGSAAVCHHPQPANLEDLGLWDMATEKERLLLRGVWGVRAFFSPDGKTVITRYFDLKEKTAKLEIWDVATGKEQPVLPGYRSVFGNSAFSPDGKILATESAERGITLLDRATGKELGRIPGAEEYGKTNPVFTFSPDGKFLAQYGGVRYGLGHGDYLHIHLWNVTAHTKCRQLGRQLDGYWTLAFSPDARTVAAAVEDNRIHLWEVATGAERLVLEGHPGRINKLLFAEHGKTLVSTSADTTALVWDLTGLRSQGGLAEEKSLSGDLKALWSALANTDGVQAYQAIWRLAASPSRTVPFLKEHLHPVKAVDEKTLASLIADLDSRAYRTREKAMRELSALDRLAEPALRKALASQPSLELRQRIEHLLEQMEAVPSPEQLRAIRAVEALELAGSAEARHLLEVLASGAPAARLTQEAKASAERLAKLSAAQNGD